MTDLPYLPAVRLLERATPTIAEDLRECQLRVAFRLDPDINACRRLTPAAALGLVSHALMDRAAKGAFDHVHDAELEAAIQETWEREIGRLHDQLRAARPLGPPPVPQRWPGYQLTRIAMLNAATSEARAHRDKRAPIPGSTSSVATEAWLEDPGTGLAGRVDRIEWRDGEAEVVDLKSGWTQTPEISAKHRRQLLIYAALVRRSTGTWPRRVTIRTAAGAAATIELDPLEAEQAAAEAAELMQSFNSARSRGASLDELASPQPEACQRCDFRIGCRPFFDALDASWPLHLKALLGTVQSSQSASDHGSVLIGVQHSNLDGDSNAVRVVGVPADLLPSPGTLVAAVDLEPTRSATTLRTTWKSWLATWQADRRQDSGEEPVKPTRRDAEQTSAAAPPRQ